MTPSLYIRQLLKDFYLDDTCDQKSRTFYISFSLLTKHSSFPTQGIGQLATILLKTAHLENAYTLHNIFFFIIDQTFLFSYSWHWSTSHEFKKKCTMKKTSKLFVFKTFVSTSINQFSIDHSYFCISQKLHYQVCLLVKMDPEQYPDSSITFFQVSIQYV